MSIKFFLFVLTVCIGIFITDPLMAQTTNHVNKQPTSCSKSTTRTSNVVTKKTAPKYVKINLPANYKPPVANEKLITFPETSAGEKKQKQLLQKRKKSKKAKKQGCMAANL